ncbi:hypothetical protein [Streptosporangium sp. NPDC050280]|uniref:hypothetical protein n=1 Tax=unclassified Streptosporangium TaxID=2632669 RepID=UPI0034276528
MSPIARTLQILLMVSGFAVLGYAALWDMDDATGWQCRATKIGKEPVQICGTEDGVQTPILLGMGGLALEIASVSVAVGARSRDSVRASPSAVPVSFPPAPFGSGQPPHAPAAPPNPWPTQMPPQAQPGQR